MTNSPEFEPLRRRGRVRRLLVSLGYLLTARRSLWIFTEHRGNTSPFARPVAPFTVVCHTRTDSPGHKNKISPFYFTYFYLASSWLIIRIQVSNQQKHRSSQLNKSNKLNSISFYLIHNARYDLIQICTTALLIMQILESSLVHQLF